MLQDGNAGSKDGYSQKGGVSYKKTHRAYSFHLTVVKMNFGGINIFNI